MSQLIYSVAGSLDGYHTDTQGSFAWAEPDDTVIAALIADIGSVSTYLYGRRMYEAMAVWETEPGVADYSPESANWAEAWARADKIVFSRTLEDTWTSRTSLERELTPGIVERARANASGDLTIEGPELASHALRMGLVDAIEVLICPIVVGGGARMLPEGINDRLSLRRARHFDNGMVQVTYGVDRS